VDKIAELLSPGQGKSDEAKATNELTGRSANAIWACLLSEVHLLDAEYLDSNGHAHTVSVFYVA